MAGNGAGCTLRPPKVGAFPWTVYLLVPAPNSFFLKQQCPFLLLRTGFLGVVVVVCLENEAACTDYYALV